MFNLNAHLNTQFNTNSITINPLYIALPTRRPSLGNHKVFPFDQNSASPSHSSVDSILVGGSRSSLSLQNLASSLGLRVGFPYVGVVGLITRSVPETKGVLNE